MASSVFFNGRTTVTPSSLVKVDATGLAVVGLGATGIIACLGEAQGGSPYNGDDPVISITNPARALVRFLAGDLREAGSFLFQPSIDPDIPGGAQQVKFVKVNPATQSAVTLPNGAGDALTLTSVDYGLFTTQINAVVATGTTTGKKYTFTYQDTVEVFDNVGGTAIFTLLYTPGTGGATTMVASLDPGVGVVASFTKTAVGENSAYNAGYSAGTGQANDLVNTVTAGAVVNIVSTSASDVQVATIIGLDNTGGTVPKTESLTLTGTTPVVGAQTWSKVLGIVLASAAIGTITLNDNGDNDDLFVLTVGETTQGVLSFAGDPIEVGNAAVTIALDAAGAHTVVFVGKDAAAANQLEKATTNGTTEVTTSGSWSQISYIAVAEIPNARTVTLDGLLWNLGDAVRVISSSASDGSTKTLTVYGLDEAGLAQSETLTLNGTTAVIGTATWSRILGATMSAAAAGTVSITNEDNDFTALSITVGLSEVGTVPINNVAMHGGVATIVADGSTSQIVVLFGYAATGVAQVEKFTLNSTTPVTGSLFWSRLTGIAVAHLSTARTLTISGTVANLTLAGYPTVNDVTAYLSALSGWTVTTAADGGTVAIADMDDTASGTVIGSAKSFGGDLAAAVAVINAGSALVTAEAATGATGAPSNTTSAVFLAGGIEGATAFADWQAALDVLRDEFVNTVTVLTDDPAVHAAVKAHCVYMAGQGRQERDAKLGAPSGTTLSEAQDLAQDLNTRHVQLCIQDVERFNTDGEREQFPPYFTALLAAGMQAGSPVGTPLTNHYVDALDVIGDSSYNVTEDSDELINSGLLMLQQKPGVGWRWLRNVTTHLIDDNPAYVEAAVNEAVNFIAYNIRTNVEFAIGKKAFQGTANAVADVVIRTLTDMADPNGQFALTTWRGLTVEIEGDIIRIDVEVAPIQGVNFVLTTLHLVSAAVSAAA